MITKKKLITLAVVSMVACMSVLTAQTAQAKTTTYPVEGSKTATIKVTTIYSTHNFEELYILYEENTEVYDDAEAERILYEFIAEYKREHKFSRFSVEDLKAQSSTKKKTTMLKRVVFEQVNKTR